MKLKTILADLFELSQAITLTKDDKGYHIQYGFTDICCTSPKECFIVLWYLQKPSSILSDVIIIMESDEQNSLIQHILKYKYGVAWGVEEFPFNINRNYIAVKKSTMNGNWYFSWLNESDYQYHKNDLVNYTSSYYLELI